MQIVTNADEVAEQLQQAGYRPEYADFLTEDLSAVKDGSMIGLAEVEEGKFWVEIQYKVNMGHQVEITGLAASLHQRDEWLEFEGLPSARQVWQQLNAPKYLEEAVVQTLPGAELAVQLQRVGLYQEGMELKSGSVMSKVELCRQILPVQLNIKAHEGKLELSSYYLYTDRKLNELEHFTLNGVSTFLLDKMMENIDWRADHDGLSPYARKRIDAVYRDLGKLQEGYAGRSEEAQQMVKWMTYDLSLKHFGGTPVEKRLLAESPYNRAMFEDGHFFNGNVSIAEIQNKINNLEELNGLMNNGERSPSAKHVDMNENNLQYNKNLLEKLGFGTALNDALEKFVIGQQPEIKLSHEATHFRDNVEYTLHFRKSESTDMYFFNRYEATLKSSDEAFNRTQSFQIRNGNNITAQEAFNLVSGRAVNKELFTANGDRYEAWLKLDFSQKDKYGNYEVTQFHQNYGYDLEKALSKFPIKELGSEEEKVKLISSLQKGNMQQVTMDVDGKDTKFFVEANPRFRTLNIKDELGNTVKRDKVEKKDLSKTQKLDEALGKDKSEKKGKGKALTA